MIPSKDLFLLIKSLSKAEKGYFKKYASRHSLSGKMKFMRMFDEIEKQSKYDEAALKNNLEKDISSKNFAASKAYLHEIILRSLNSFYVRSNKDSELKESLRSIENLYRKALYTQCQRKIKKTKLESYKYDNYAQLLELIKWEKNLVHEGFYSGKPLDNLEKLYNEENELLNRLKNLSELRILSYRIQNLYAREGTASHKEAVKKFLADPLLADENIYSSIPEKINYNHIKSSLYGQTSDIAASYFHKKRIVELMEEDAFKIKDNPVNYIISLSNLLTACSEMKSFKEFDLYLDKIHSLADTLHSIPENTRVLAFMGATLPQLKMKLNNPDYELTESDLDYIDKGIAKYSEKSNRFDETLCLYFIAIIHFKNKNFERSLAYINRILKESDNDISPEALINSRIFNLMVHYELNNIQLVEHLTASYIRYVELRKDTDEAQKSILKFFRKISGLKGESGLSSVIKVTAEKLQQVMHSQPHLLIFKYFDFPAYFKNKLA